MLDPNPLLFYIVFVQQKGVVMKVIEDWIDRKLDSLVVGSRGYIVLTDEDISELAKELGLQEGIRDYIYYQVDMHKDYFQERLEAYAQEYEEQEKTTFKVENDLCQ